MPSTGVTLNIILRDAVLILPTVILIQVHPVIVPGSGVSLHAVHQSLVIVVIVRIISVFMSATHPRERAYNVSFADRARAPSRCQPRGSVNGQRYSRSRSEHWGTYMHSAWNSWPHGKLITWLTPSTYSSKHTTHSRCLPPYLRRHSMSPASRFSWIWSKLNSPSFRLA